jgi:hypothetical protein
MTLRLFLTSIGKYIYKYIHKYIELTNTDYSFNNLFLTP